MMERHGLTFPGVLASVGPARHYVRDTVPPHLGDAAALGASELIANAVLHTRSGEPGGTVHVAITVDGAHARVEVTDLGTDQAAPHVVSDDVSETGRGLLLVREVADHWGERKDDGGGRTMWFTLGDK